MPIDEFTELQEKLAETQPRIDPRGASRNAVETVTKGELEREKSPVEYIQWAILPNGTFCAVGAAEPKLPVGAYLLNNTPMGLFFIKTKIMTDTLIDLGNSNSLRVIEGIKLFWKRRERYQERGILFKRGILMWGPPGSGKTATLAMLVEDLINQGGIVLLVQHPSTAVQALRILRKIEPERPLIVVLEDVEEIIASNGEHDLLALLDGEHQTDNVVNIATTNYPELLGARIINRPSRFDEVVKIGMPSAEMRLQYLVHILGPDGETVNIDQWVNETNGMSIAHLKELVVAVICLEQPYQEVIARLKTMKSTPRSQMYEDKIGFLGGNGAQLQASMGGECEAPSRRR